MIDMPRGGKRPGAGRPRKYGRAALSKVLPIRATTAELVAWKRTAGERPTSEWAREILNREAKFLP